MDADKLAAAFGFIARQAWHADGADLGRIQADLERLEALAAAHCASWGRPKEIDRYGAAHLAWTPRRG